MINTRLEKEFLQKKFGSLTPVKFIRMSDIGNNQIWLFKCDCGEEVERRKSNVIHGKRNSCGCTWKQRKHGMATIQYNSKNSVRRHPIYHSWVNMRQRCFNTETNDYKYYGARGIKVCERWNDFVSFYEDMFPSWNKGLTLDRIDVNGNYEPSNCRWATRHEQSNNRNYNKVVEFNGEIKTIDQWRKKLNLKVSHKLIRQRIFSKNWSPERAFYTPARKM